ncbi:MAG TPA: hypothetical protein VK666_17930 [Chryseolinea sp.]|nr:hypothetical protein [Chryseolinea sp.]
MDGDNRKSLLELKVIWKDDHMFQLRVTATNGRYSGTTEVYDTSVSLANFAKSLLGYPKDEQVLFHNAGQTDGYSYFEMRFYCIDNAGHVGVQVSLEEYNSTRPEEKDKLKLEIIVEPSAIDNFQRELLQLAVNENGIARLYGRNN